MKLLAQNCRVFRASPTTRRLRRIIKGKNPAVVFLSESLCLVSLASKFFVWQGLPNVDPQGKKGGLILVWSDLLMLHIVDMNPPPPPPSPIGSMLTTIMIMVC